MSDVMRDPRFQKLPVWAREQIRLLIQSKRAADALAAEALQQTDPASTNTRVQSSGTGFHEIGLENHARVRFYLTNSRGNEQSYIDARIERAGHSLPDQLVIMASGSIVTRHISGNHCAIDLLDRR